MGHPKTKFQIHWHFTFILSPMPEGNFTQTFQYVWALSVAHTWEQVEHVCHVTLGKCLQTEDCRDTWSWFSTLKMYNSGMHYCLNNYHTENIVQVYKWIKSNWNAMISPFEGCCFHGDLEESSISRVERDTALQYQRTHGSQHQQHINQDKHQDILTEKLIQYEMSQNSTCRINRIY